MSTVPGRSFKSRGVLGLICAQGVPFSMTERSCSRKTNVLMETNHMLPSHLFCVLTATLHVGDSLSPQCAMCNACVYIDGEILSTWNMGFDAFAWWPCGIYMVNFIIWVFCFLNLSLQSILTEDIEAYLMSLELWSGRTGSQLQMNRLSLWNSRLKFKTAGKLPISLEEFIEYTPIK
jgi:hypothetical protein